jgi:integrase
MRQVGKATRFAGVFRVDENTHRIRAVGIDQRTGKRRQLERLVQGVSAQQASRLRAEMLDEIQQSSQAVQRVRVGEFAQSWMRSKAIGLDEAVARTYSDVLEQHILPVFGDLYYDVITKADVQGWVDRSLGSSWRSIKKSNKRKRKGANASVPPRAKRKGEEPKNVEKTYSRNSVAGWFRVFRAMTRDAVDTLGLQRDPTLRIRLPADEEREPNNLTPKEMLRFIELMKQHYPRQYGLVAVLAFTGLRFCHASALRWEDWDEVENVIYVRRKQSRGRIAPVSRKKRAPPVIPVTPELKEALTEHRNWLELDEVPNRHTLMFPSATGTLRTPNTLDFAKTKCLELAGIDRRFTLHGCRYSFTDLTRLAKVDAVTRRALTGHVTEQMQRHYSTVDVAEKREAMEAAMNVLKTAKAELERKKAEAENLN